MKNSFLLFSLLLSAITTQAQNQAWKIIGNGNIDPTLNFLGTTNANDVVFKSNNTEHGRLTSGGTWNLGQVYVSDQLAIGAESFTYKLNVENSTTTRSGYFNNTYNTNSTKYGLYNVVSNAGTGARYGIYNSSTSNTASALVSYGLYNTVTNPGSGNAYGLYSFVSPGGTGTHYGVYSSSIGSTNYAFYGSGRGYFSDNVGLGTTSPAVKLHINGSDEVLRIDGTSPYINLRDGGEDLGFLWANGEDIILGTNGNNDDGKLILRTNTIGRVYVNSSGNVGVGISDPLTRFHVDGSGETFLLSGVSDPYMQLAQNGINVGYVQADAEDLRIGVNADNLFGVMRFSTNATTRMLIDGDGNVGIGVIDPANLAAGYLLSVDGKVMCEELRVELSSSWPDYVFDNDYDLMSFQKLRAFIQQNKHLPGIPSVKGIDERGLQVGEMQTQLLEKVEELTLYILQLEQRVHELEAKQ